MATKEDHIIWGVEVQKPYHEPWVYVSFDEQQAEEDLKSFTASGYTGRVVYREMTPWKERENANEKEMDSKRRS